MMFVIKTTLSLGSETTSYLSTTQAQQRSIDSTSNEPQKGFSSLEYFLELS
jgi:hypothetical protein